MKTRTLAAKKRFVKTRTLAANFLFVSFAFICDLEEKVREDANLGGKEEVREDTNLSGKFPFLFLFASNCGLGETVGWRRRFVKTRTLAVNFFFVSFGF